MFVCPLLTDLNFLKTWIAFVLILNCAFLNKLVEIQFSKCIVTVPVQAQKVCIYHQIV